MSKCSLDWHCKFYFFIVLVKLFIILRRYFVCTNYNACFKTVSQFIIGFMHSNSDKGHVQTCTCCVNGSHVFHTTLVSVSCDTQQGHSGPSNTFLVHFSIYKPEINVNSTLLRSNLHC